MLMPRDQNLFHQGRHPFRHRRRCPFINNTMQHTTHRAPLTRAVITVDTIAMLTGMQRNVTTGSFTIGIGGISTVR